VGIPARALESPLDAADSLAAEAFPHLVSYVTIVPQNAAVVIGRWDRSGAAWGPRRPPEDPNKTQASPWDPFQEGAARVVARRHQNAQATLPESQAGEGRFRSHRLSPRGAAPPVAPSPSPRHPLARQGRSSSPLSAPETPAGDSLARGRWWGSGMRVHRVALWRPKVPPGSSACDKVRSRTRRDHAVTRASQGDPRGATRARRR
jgi:hypothetical protein